MRGFQEPHTKKYKHRRKSLGAQANLEVSFWTFNLRGTRYQVVCSVLWGGEVVSFCQVWRLWVGKDPKVGELFQSLSEVLPLRPHGTGSRRAPGEEREGGWNYLTRLDHVESYTGGVWEEWIRCLKKTKPVKRWTKQGISAVNYTGRQYKWAEVLISHHRHHPNILERLLCFIIFILST